MAQTPLGAAILTANDPATSSLFGADPTIAAALPDYQLGSEMQQQGLNTSPAYAPQAWSRLAQAIAGTYLKSSALGDINKASANLPSHMADILEQTQKGSPLIPMLRSDDPIVRMTGLRLMDKIIPIQAQLEKVGPNQDVTSGSQNMFKSSNPITPTAQAAKDAQNAAAQGNPQAVTAIERAVTKEVTNPETGTNLPPTPLIPRQSGLGASPAAVIPPSSMTGGAGASPTAAIQPPPMQPPDVRVGNTVDPNKDQSQVPPPAGPTNAPTGLPAQIAQAKGLQKGAEEGAAAQVKYGSLLQPQGPIPKGPGLTEPIKTDHGTTLPPLASQQPVPTTPAELDQKLPVWTKTTTDWNASLAPGYAAEQRLNSIAGAFKQIQTGSWATHKADFIAGLNSAGIPISQDKMNDVNAVQMALHENYIKTIQQLKASNSRWTQMEFRAISENSEHPNLQPGANLQMLGEDLAQLRQSRDMVTDWNGAQRNGWRDPQSFESEWLKQNPFQGYVDSAKQQIGPLKGMSPSGALPKFNSPDDVHSAVAAKKLTSGQQFLLPDGRVGTVP
jgi:hypothetical protein